MRVAGPEERGLVVVVVAVGAEGDDDVACRFGAIAESMVVR